MNHFSATLSTHPILISVTDLFRLDSEEIPLPSSQHLGEGEEERTCAQVAS
jgi:hypothetical protein